MLRVPRYTGHLLHKHYKPILVVAFAATVVGGYLTSKLSLRSDLAELLPDSFESVQALNRMKEQVGGIGQLRIVFEADDFSAVKRLAQDLEPRLLSSPYVNYVDYKNDLAFYKRNALLYLDTATLDSLDAAVQNTIEKEKQRLNPFLVEDLFGEDGAEEGGDELAKWEEKYRAEEPKPFYTNADSTILVVRVFPSRSSSDLSFNRAMVEAVERIVDATHPELYDRTIKVYYGGNIKNQVDEYETVKRDILGTILYGVSGVFLLIVLYFRRVLGAILISTSLLFSLAWTFGVTYLVIGELNTITGFLFVILFGLGIDYGIHAFARYVESRQEGLATGAAIEKMVSRTGTAIGTTAVTTSAAFFTLMLMDFKGFSHLGFIAGVGILFAFLSMVVVLPAFIVLAEDTGLLRIRPAPKAKLSWERRSFRYSKGILLAAAALTVVAAVSFSRVDFEYDFTDLRVVTQERETVAEKTRGVFTRSESPAVVLADSREEAEEVMAAVRWKMKQDTLTPTINSVSSVYSLVPEDQPQKLRKIREIRELVEEEAEGLVKGEEKRRLDELRAYLHVDTPFTLEDVPRNEKRRFLNKKGELGSFVFIYPSVALRDGRNAIDFRNDVGTITTGSGKVFHATSSSIISAEMLILMMREGKTAVLLTFIVVFLIVLADFRSAKSALLVLSPLVIGVVWMGGVMYLIGMELNFFNIVVLPSILGVGVDNGVHIHHRYLEEGSGSLYFVLRNTGLTIGVTTLTTIAGYSGLILASHPGLASMGELAVIGLSATFVTAVLVLPALIQLFDRKETAQGA